MTTKVLRRAVDHVTVDVPSFERARAAIPNGATLVLTPSHRSYLDFVLTSYLAFARPDLLPIPHIAATMDFAAIPLLGRVLGWLHAFYLRSGQGKMDPQLAPRVEALIDGGNTLAFFIEGARSRSGEFLPPKRGLLRCLQSTGRTCALLPIAITYERVPEHEAFARELAGEPKAKMRLGALVSWTFDAWRGRIDLGRIHIAAGAPVMLDSASDVHAVSHEVIRRLRDAMLGTTIPQPLPLQRDDAWTPPAKTSRRAGVKAAR
jgi:fatty acyl-CoA reductase